jgi:hypothetical protein
MPLLFPSTPSIGQQYSYNGRTWQWTGSVWQSVGTIQGLQGSQGGIGGSGIQGIQGFIGLQGGIGVQGLQGNQGLQGPNAAIYFSTTPPSSPLLGDRWTDSTTGSGYTWVTDGVNFYWVELSASGYAGIQGNQGVQGPAGSMQGIQGIQGPNGVQGLLGLQGPSGFNNFNAISVDALPNADQTYNLGSATKNWASVHTAKLDFAADGEQTVAYVPPAPIAYAASWTGATTNPVGGVFDASYTQLGKLIHLDIQINCSSVTNFGSGAYSLTLPILPAHTAELVGTIIIGTTRYTLKGRVTTGSLNVPLFYLNSSGNNNPIVENAFTPTAPANLTTSSSFVLNGPYIAA